MSGDTDDLEQCAHCGSTLPLGEWCPIVTTTDDDGSTRLHSFCDEACRDAWMNVDGDERDDH